MVNLQSILQSFGEATGLFTNMQKSELYPIQCEATELAAVTSAFPGRICQFPCRYLGLPLRIGRTRRADEQILIDKIRARLSGWKGRLLTKAGRMTLVSSVLSSIPTYHLWCQNGQSSVLTGYDVISFGEEKILQEVATARLVGYASVGPKS